MYKIGYFGFNDMESTDSSVDRYQKILTAVRKASGYGKENVLITWGTCHNGKRHVEVLPIDEPGEAAAEVAKELFAAGFNVVLLPNAPLVLWDEKFER